MMKRIIAVFLTLMVAVCLLTVNVSASSDAVLSDDLQTLTCGDRNYIRGDISGIFYYELEPIDLALQIPETLDSELRSYRVAVACNKAIIRLRLNYRDGTSLELGFVESPYAQELQTLTLDDNLDVTTSYYWKGDDVLTAPLSSFKRSPITVDSQALYDCDLYYVSIYSDALDNQIYRGIVFVNAHHAYYIDFRENGIVGQDMDNPYEWPEVNGYEITDPELFQTLLEDYKSRNDFGISEDDHLEQVLSAIFLCFVFAGIPIAVLIPAAIAAIRGKGYYKVTWGVTAGLCAAELSIFVITVGQILLS